MFAKLNSNLVAYALIALLVITRASHFGNASLLPDASIACFFLLGALNARIRWMLLAILIAVAIDLIVTRLMIVSDYCMSPGYWGLIPIYGMVWWLGRRIHHLQGSHLKTYFSHGWIATTLAFILSNAVWYVFSDKVNMMNVSDFSFAVAKYYLPYTGFTMFYLAASYAVMQFAASLKSQRGLNKA